MNLYVSAPAYVPSGQVRKNHHQVLGGGGQPPDLQDVEPDPAGGGHGPEHPGGARGRRIQIHGRVCSLGRKMQVNIFHTIVIINWILW